MVNGGAAAPAASPRQAPVAPPRVRGAPLSQEQLKRLSAALPLSPAGHEEREGEEDLFNTLQQFYLKWEPDRVGQGIGHIVEWAQVNGVEALNSKLQAKYGQNLHSFEESRKRAEVEAEGNPLRKERLPESFMNYGSHVSSPQATIRDRLLAFYTEYDADRLRKGVDDLVDYVSRKGLPALNEKLVAKYGLTLEDFENGVGARGTSGGRAAAPSVGAGVGPAPRMSLRQILRTSFRRNHAHAPAGTLPPHVRPLLEMYYSKYDQSKISSGGVNAIFKWSEKNGVKALNAQLKQKYLEDLDEFADRMNKLREDLETFYKIHDPKKVEGDGVDRILRWGVRNGRAAINKQLRQKYKCDLEQKDPSKLVEAEPDF